MLKLFVSNIYWIPYNVLFSYFHEALVGEGPSEEKLFSLKSNSMRENIGSELQRYILKLKI